MCADKVADNILVGNHCMHVLWHYVVEVTKAVDVYVCDGHICAHPCGDLCCVRAHYTATKDQYLSRHRSRYASQQDSTSLQRLLKILGSLLDGHSSCYL